MSANYQRLARLLAEIAYKQAKRNVVLTPHLATEARPREAYKNLLIGIDQQVSCTDWWAGWAYPHHTRTRIAA